MEICVAQRAAFVQAGFLENAVKLCFLGVAGIEKSFRRSVATAAV